MQEGSIVQTYMEGWVLLFARNFESRNIRNKTCLHNLLVEVVCHCNGKWLRETYCEVIFFSCDESSTSNDKPQTHKKPQDSRDQSNKDQKKQQRQTLSK